MPKPIARFQLMNGLAGCYMPDHHSGPYVVTRRKDLIDAVRDQLAFLDMPKSAIRQVNWTRVWRFIKFAGDASQVHVTMTHKGYALELCGMTEGEADEMERNCEG